MKILYLSERDPRDTHFGGAQRTNYIWRALQQCGEVYCICFDQQYRTEEITPRIWHGRKLLKVNAWHYFWYRLERKILEPFNVLPLWPIQTKLEKSIEEIFPDVKFDIVVCRYCVDLAEMHLWNYPKVYVDFDDHPLEIYDTLKCLDVKPRLRPLGRWILKQQLKYIEKKITGGWVSNPEQVFLFDSESKIVPLRNIPALPSENYYFESARKPLIITVGAMSYYPNYHGVDKFLSDIWPAVHAKYPELEFAIIGKGAPEEYTEKWSKVPKVKVMGFVENLEIMYQNCLCSLVSIFAGGGTCIKTLESLSYGRVCLATPFGARGMDQDGHSGLFVYKSPQDVLHYLDVFIMDAEARATNERLAMSYVAGHYSLTDFIETVQNTIKPF